MSLGQADRGFASDGDRVFDRDHGETACAPLLDLDVRQPARSLKVRPDGNVVVKMDLPPAENDARQPQVWQGETEACHAVVAQRGCGRVGGEQGEMPSARQRITLAPACGIQIERGCHAPHERQGASVGGDDGIVGVGHGEALVIGIGSLGSLRQAESVVGQQHRRADAFGGLQGGQQAFFR